MGGCRTLNVLLGMSVLREDWRIEHWIVAAGVGVYIAGVTWFARDDARRSDRRQLTAAALVMLAGVALVGALPWLSDGDHAQAADRFAELGHIDRRAGRLCYRSSCAGDTRAVARPGPRGGGPLDHGVDLSRCGRLFCRCGATYAILIAVLVLPSIVVSRWVQSVAMRHHVRRWWPRADSLVHLQGTMLLGYNTNGLAHHDLFDAVELLADIGYRSVAITIDHTALSPRHANHAQELARLREILERRGMRSVIETGARYLLDPRAKHEPTLVSPGPQGRLRAARLLQTCHRHGRRPAKRLRLALVGPKTGGHSVR